MKNLHARIQKIALLPHIALTLIAFAAFRGSQFILDALYARSQFPVPYATGQTAFDGDIIKGYYEHMIEAGTLNIYWQTQLFDYVFMAGMFAFGMIMPLLVRRIYKEDSWAYRLTTLTAFLIPIGACFDAVENLASFIMLANPTTFPNWIAPIYSSFAVLKFASIGTGYILLLIGFIIFIIAKATTFVTRANKPQLI